jgi:hypothetical protein
MRPWHLASFAVGVSLLLYGSSVAWSFQDYVKSLDLNFPEDSHSSNLLFSLPVSEAEFQYKLARRTLLTIFKTDPMTFLNHFFKKDFIQALPFIQFEAVELVKDFIAEHYEKYDVELAVAINDFRDAIRESTYLELPNVTELVRDLLGIFWFKAISRTDVFKTFLNKLFPYDYYKKIVVFDQYEDFLGLVEVISLIIQSASLEPLPFDAHNISNAGFIMDAFFSIPDTEPGKTQFLSLDRHLSRKLKKLVLNTDSEELLKCIASGKNRDEVRECIEISWVKNSEILSLSDRINKAIPFLRIHTPLSSLDLEMIVTKKQSLSDDKQIRKQLRSIIPNMKCPVCLSSLRKLIALPPCGDRRHCICPKCALLVKDECSVCRVSGSKHNLANYDNIVQVSTELAVSGVV